MPPVYIFLVALKEKVWCLLEAYIQVVGGIILDGGLDGSSPQGC